MSPEAWRPIPGYTGYDASDRGNIRSWVAPGGGRRRIKPSPSPLNPWISGSGYPAVTIRRDGAAGRTERRVHQLVALAFLGERPEGFEVCHIDGNKLNPAAANLRYGTRRENVLDQIRHGHHVNASKTHCKRGHEFTASNTRIETTGGRRCLTCEKQRDQRRATRRTAA